MTEESMLVTLPWGVIASVGGGLLVTAMAWGSQKKAVTVLADLQQSLGRRLDSLDARFEAARSDLDAFKLLASDTFVRKPDLRDMEDRLGKRLDKMEDTVANKMTRIISIVSGNREWPGEDARIMDRRGGV